MSSKQTANKIVNWYRSNARDLPWRHTTNPYKIWLSEIILQQTTIGQGTAYYNRFVNEFPTVVKLASSPLDKILKLWDCLLYTSPSPRDATLSRMPSSA